MSSSKPTNANSTNETTLHVFVCRGCGRVFKERNTFNTHSLSCAKPVKGESFQKLYDIKQPEVIGRTNNIPKVDCGHDADKIMPLSQSMQPIQKHSSENVLPKQPEPDTEMNMSDYHEKTVDDTVQLSQSVSSPQNLTEHMKMQRKKVVCTSCNRLFESIRGLNIHQHTCKKKNDQQAQVTVSRDPTPGVVLNPELNEHLVPQTANPPNGTQTKIWGNHSVEDISQITCAIYEEIVYWKKNLFKLPSGAAGKQYIKEMTRLINIWNEDCRPLSGIALKLVMIMPALLLQKPSRKSTAKQHSEYLNKRLTLWEIGSFDQLMREVRSIQQKLKENQPKNESTEQLAKRFAKLMLAGKVHAALRLLDKAESVGVLNLTDEVLSDLKSLHPDAKHAPEVILMDGELPWFDPVVFTNIDESSITKAALKTRGAAGPSGLDADGWRRMLVSKNFGKTGKDLRISIAKMTQQLCTQELTLGSVENKRDIEAYTACRLIPLEKSPSGVRPIGIGEVLRRIIGKAVVAEIKPELVEAAGCLQLCAGQASGCEAAAHAMRDIFGEEETDGVLLIDATNAFNTLNRNALLHNIRYLCPSLSTYVRNVYGCPARLFVSGGSEIVSSEGTTQGCPVAMNSYGIGILPLLTAIKPENEPEKMKHVAYADDLGGGSRLKRLREWWDRCVEHGPAFGYYPKASKSWLIVKEDQLEGAKELFRGTGVQVTTEGRKYLGGFVGTTDGKEKYVGELVNTWVDQLQTLAMIAKSEPQAAYTAFTSGFRHKITYFIRTIPDLQDVLKPLDKVIDSKLIPAITEGHYCSSRDRRLLSLPVRLGGLGIPIFSELCVREYAVSRETTKQLRIKIQAQQHNYNIDTVKQKEVEAKLKKERATYEKKELEKIRKQMSKEELRANDISQMKGGSSWLTTLPLQDEEYTLNKREFFDAIALRYRWQIKRLPIHCACNSNKNKFDVDHAMNCKTGGFVHRRHDNIRDLLGEFVDGIAYDVRIEPPLQPLTGEVLSERTCKDDDARLDFSARGFYQKGEMALFDVKVINPFAKSHMSSKLETIFKRAENDKKTKIQ